MCLQRSASRRVDGGVNRVVLAFERRVCLPSTTASRSVGRVDAMMALERSKLLAMECFGFFELSGDVVKFSRKE